MNGRSSKLTRPGRAANDRPGTAARDGLQWTRPRGSTVVGARV